MKCVQVMERKGNAQQTMPPSHQASCLLRHDHDGVSSAASTICTIESQQTLSGEAALLRDPALSAPMQSLSEALRLPQIS